MDDVGSGAARYLSGFPNVTGLLGSFSGADPVVANRGLPWLFAGDLLVTIKGSGSAALVLTDYGGWSAPPMLGSQRFRRLRVDLYQDSQRDSQGNVNSSHETTINLLNALFNAVHGHLHRRDPDTILWGDMVTFGAQLLTEPVPVPLPDGDWAMWQTAIYGVYLSGWTDVAS